MLARLEQSEKRRAAHRRGAGRARGRPQRRSTSTAWPTPLIGALGGQPEQPAGAPARRATARSGSPTRLQGMPAWVIDYVLVHELAHLLEPGHDAGVLGAGSTATRKAERAKGFLEGWSRPRPARHRGRPAGLLGRGRRSDGRPTTSEPRASAGRDQLGACPARRSGRSSTGHQRTSSDSSLTAWRAPAGASGEEPYVEVVDRRRAGRRTPPRARRGAAAPGRGPGPAMPGLLGGLAQRGAGQRGSPGSQWPPKWNHRRALRCRLSSTCAPVGGEHQRAGGEVVGEAGRASARRGARSRWSTYRRAQRAPAPASGARPGPQRRRARRRAGVTSAVGPSRAVGRRRRTRRRAARAARRRSRRR